MQSQVREIATTMPVSFESAGTAIGEVNTRFGLTGDALKGLSEDFLRFAEINDTDVNNSIDTIQSAMAAFNTDTEKASQVLDLFTAAGQQTGIPIESLAESVKKNAVALQEMGFGL
jgi:TP901 family phage tail tape measure protein